MTGITAWILAACGLAVASSAVFASVTYYQNARLIVEDKETTPILLPVATSSLSESPVINVESVPVSKKQTQPIINASITVQSQVEINSCIDDAKQERDRRMSGLDSIWVYCLQNDAAQYPGICDDVKTKIETESKPAVYRKFEEWKDECMRGLVPDLKEFAY